MTRMKLWYR